MIFITNGNEDFTDDLIEFGEDKVHWLQLWPVLNNDYYERKFKNLTIHKYDEFISNKDHYFIEKEVDKFKYETFEILKNKNFEINKLKISQIFSYELNQPLSKLFFLILCIDKFLKLFPNSKNLVFAGFSENRKTEILIKNSYVKTLIKILKTKHNFNFSYKSTIELNKRFKFNDIILNHFKTVKTNILKFGFKITINKILIKLNNKVSVNSIIISNSTRCLEGFYDLHKDKSQIYILDNSNYFYQNNQLDLYSDNYSLFFLEYNISNLRLNVINYSLNEFENLKSFYSKTIKFISKNRPKLYITIDIMSSLNIVKMWAFKSNNVKVVLSAESLGLTSADIRLYNVLSSVLHPEIKDIERWVVSEFSKKAIHKNINNVIVSGYLGRIMNLGERSSNKSKTVLFCLSGAANNHVTRPIQDENMFEILKSVTDLADILSNQNHLNLIIKTHPGENLNIPLYAEAASKNKNTKIICDGNLTKLLTDSDVVIVYDTSVALEALYLKKSVICYDYLNRPSNLSQLRDNIIINKDISYLDIAKNKRELKEKINKSLTSDFDFKNLKLSQYIENNYPEYSDEFIIKLISN